MPVEKTEAEILDMIAKLLAKAESTTPEEADALTQHAERLMLRHGIERARAEAAKLGRDIKPEEIVTITMGLPTGHYGAAYAGLANQIAHAYGSVRVYRWRNGTGRRIHSAELRIIGYQTDAEAVRTLILSLLMQGRTAMDTWHRRESAWGRFDGCAPATIAKAKRDYLVGFGQGAAEKLRTMRTKVHAEAETEQPGTAVAVLDRSKAVERHFADFSKEQGLRTTSMRITGTAKEGQRDGRNANVGGNALGGSPRALGA